MANIWKGITNGGANRFFTDKNGVIKVGGSDVGGRPAVDGDLIEELWGIELTFLTGDISKITNFSDAFAGAKVLEDGSIRLSGKGVKGSVIIEADGARNAKALESYFDFLEDLFNVIDGIGTDFLFDKVTNLEDALAGAKVLENGNIKFGGAGVKGNFQITPDEGLSAEAVLQYIELFNDLFG